MGSYSEDDLEELFDNQIQILKNYGGSEQILFILESQRSSVTKKASQMTFGEGHIPFLPVIPRTFRTIYDQIAMVRSDSKTGWAYVNYSDPPVIIDVVETPARPYYIFDVEDGEEMRGRAAEDAEKLFAKQGRRGLVVVEVIALCVHTNVLLRHDVDAVGSSFKFKGYAPYVDIVAGRPGLRIGCRERTVHRWGAASCLL